MLVDTLIDISGLQRDERKWVVGTRVAHIFKLSYTLMLYAQFADSEILFYFFKLFREKNCERLSEKNQQKHPAVSIIRPERTIHDGIHYHYIFILTGR